MVKNKYVLFKKGEKMGFIYEFHANEKDRNYLESLHLKSGFDTVLDLKANRIHRIVKNMERNIYLICSGIRQEYDDTKQYVGFYLIIDEKPIRFRAEVNDKNIEIYRISIPKSMEGQELYIKEILREALVCWFVPNKDKMNEYTIEISQFNYIPDDKWKNGGFV
jgi:hypothetical protein